MTRLLLATPLLLALAACGKDDEKSGSSGAVDAPFLTAAEFNAGSKIKTLRAADLADEVNDVDSFYDLSPDSSDSDACFDTAANAIKIAATSDTITVGGTIDLSKCLTESLDKSFEDASATATMKLYVKYVCKGVDLAPYDGKPFADDSLPDDLGCTESSIILNTSAETKFSGTYKQGTTSVKIASHSQTYSYTGTANATPCTAKLDGETETYTDGCLDIDRNITLESTTDGKADEDSGYEDYRRLEYSGLTAKKGGGKYYTGGKLKVTLNGWVGEMVYTAADVAPTWTLKQGADTQTGTFQSASLRL